MVLQSGRGTAYLQSNSRNGLGAGDIDGSAADSGEGSSNRGMRGRGSRLNNARKTVFQPTVRAPPLGMQGQGRTSSDAGRGHVETKAGHSGLALVNRKPTPTSTAIRQRKNTATTAAAVAHSVGDESSMDSGRSESDCSTKAGISNPWARRLQTQTQQQQQQTAQNQSKLATSVSRRSSTGEGELLGKASLAKPTDISIEDAAAPCAPDHSQQPGGQKLDAKTDDVRLEKSGNGRRSEAVGNCVDAMAAMEIADRTIECAVQEPQTISRPQPASDISTQHVSASKPTAAAQEGVEPRQQQQQQTGPLIDIHASSSTGAGESATPTLPAFTAAKASAPAMEIQRAETPRREDTCIDDLVASPPSQPDSAKDSGGFLPANHTWGSKARTAASKPALQATEPSKSRWWKASLSGGARKGEASLHPETRKSAASSALPFPPASSSPKPGEMNRSDDGDSRSQSNKGEQGSARSQRSSRRAQAPVPTVVPPVVLARATARTLESKPVSGAKLRSEVGRIGAVDASTRELGTAVGTSSDDGKAMEPIPRPSDERSRQQQAETLLATGADETVVAETADESKAVQRNGVAEKETLLAPTQEAEATSKSKKRLSTNGAMQTGSWRSSGSTGASTKPQPQTLDSVADALNPPLVLQKVDEKPDGASAVQRRGSSSTRALAQAPQPSAKRERGRAATSSMAATAPNWRAASNRAKNDACVVQDSAADLTAAAVSSAAFLPGNSAVLSNGAVIPQFWTGTSTEQQPLNLHNGVLSHSLANRESSATQGLRVQSGGDSYYASSIGLRNSDVERGRFADLLHFSEPQSRSTRIGLSPPLLPHTMLADILGDGEHTSSGIVGPQLPSSVGGSSAVAVSAEVADASISANTAANGSLVRGRRISSVIGIRAQGEAESAGSRGLDYGSRVRSSSSLFDANRSSTLNTGSGAAKSHLGSGFADSGLLMRPTQADIASSAADFGYLPAHDIPAPQGRPTNNGRMWDHSSMMSTQTTGHPFYADNTGGLMFGAPQTSTFSAFSSGAAMLWPEPATRPPLSREISRPPSREDSSDQHVF
ncbi:hypothetical protein H4R20_005225, partial [Coemansia guatemalensis]